MILLGRLWVALVLVAPLTAGCASGAAGTADGCSATIGWNRAVYRSHNELNQAAPRGERLGRGNVLDCDRKPIDATAPVEVFAVEGVRPSLAIRIEGREWRGVYVAVDVSRSSWPSILEAG